MATNPGLVRTQRWLQAFVVTPGQDDEVLASPTLRDEFAGPLEELVTPSKTLTSFERAGVYRGMYLLRMQEALEKDYPLVKDWLGQEQFERLVAGYVREHPSRSYTLNRLGDHLPAYIASLPRFDHQDLLHDLASFELAITEVFDEEETPALSADEIAAVPDDKWATAQMTPIAALRLRRFAYPVDSFKESYRDGEAYPAPAPDETRVAIFRHQYKVYWIPLNPTAYALLNALVGQTPLGQAIEQALLDSRVPEEEIFGWFQSWVSKGLFHSVDLA